MKGERPLILISNDDGVSARGIHKLVELVKPLGEVIVIAPDGPRSGQASALTVNSPLMVSECAPISGVTTLTVNGTPVDCVKLGLFAILDRKPYVMLAGINHGSNAAINNIYSGTMGAVMEACLQEIPSVGFSLLDHAPDADFDKMAPFVAPIVKDVLEQGLPQGICLNVNFPAHCTPRGIKVSRAARGEWTEEYKTYATPHGQPFYWLTGKFHNLEPENDETDEYWLAREYGTIVPIRPDQTAHDEIKDIRERMSKRFGKGNKVN